MSTAFVALGANLGDRAATIQAAVDALAELGEVRAISSLYETDPVGYADQPAYLNAVAMIETTLPPEELLHVMLAIEARHGRRRSFANAPRTLDLDLLLYGDEIRSTSELTIPHPRMHERAFVLVPMAEIAPDVIVPGMRSEVRSLLAGLVDTDGVRPYRTIDGST